MDLTPENAGQEPLLLLVGAEGHEGRTDTVQGEERQRHTRPVGLLDEDHLVDRPPGLTSVLHGPSEAQPAVVTHPADVLGVGRLVQGRTLDVCDQLFEVLPELTLQVPLFCRELQVHVASGRDPLSPSESILARSVPACRLGSNVLSDPPYGDI